MTARTVEIIDSPMAAFPRAIGVALVPQPRAFGQGGFADFMAERRHRRRMSQRARRGF